MSVDAGAVKRAPVEAWSTREQLWLAMAVSRCGDQNWVSVSRALRPLAAEGLRPSDWFGQRACAAQYGALLERCATGRRKKRETVEPPRDAILRRLTAARLADLRHRTAEQAKQYAQLKDELDELLESDASEARVRDMAAAVDAERRQKEKEATKHAQWLQEREQRRAALDRSWRRADSDAPHSSPLLTSLLQNPSTIAQIPITDAGGASVSPTKRVDGSMIDVSDANRVPFHELQKIEQIKSELQKIEQNYMDGALPAESNVLNVLPPLDSANGDGLASVKESGVSTTSKTPEKIDIDDIEIKAEDVYAFSDIDLDIPPVSSIHKTSVGRTSHSDKNLFNKRELAANVIGLEDVGMTPTRDGDRMQETNMLDIETPILSPGSSMLLSESNTDIAMRTTTGTDNKLDREAENKAANEKCEKEESVNILSNKVPEVINNSENNVITKDVKNSNADIKKLRDAVKIELSEIQSSKSVERVRETNTQQKQESTQAHNAKLIEQLLESHIETDDDTPIEVIKEEKPGRTKRDYSRKKTEKDEKGTSPTETDVQLSATFSDEIISDNSQESSDKKILCRKFRNELGGSRSESPATPSDSLPNSPAPATPPSHIAHSTTNQTSSERDKDYRIWKKSILLQLNTFFTLKYASLFFKPVTDEQAPRYSQVVKRPLDLNTIRRNIELGIIRTTQEFQRDVLLMLTNALMYNRTDHGVYSMAFDTIHEVIPVMSVLLQALARSAVQTPIVPRSTRPPRPVSRSTGPTMKRKRGGTDTSGDNKKRRTEDP